MKIHALTVSVNYSEWLARSADRWRKHFETWTIVTDGKDDKTADLAERIEARCYRTDSFYLQGAAFNKGRAMEEARRFMPWGEDWCLFLDADIVPEPQWYEKVRALDLQPGRLFGAPRVQCDDLADVDNPSWRKIPDAVCDGGYFHLFHTADPAVQVVPGSPLIEPYWKHAGVYDSHFAKRWPVQQRINLPIRLTHLGEKENWWGVGNREAFLKMNRERQQRGSYLHERIDE